MVEYIEGFCGAIWFERALGFQGDFAGWCDNSMKCILIRLIQQTSTHRHV